MVLTVTLFGFIIFGLAQGSLHFFPGLDLATSLFLAFTLSFSSTVFTVKMLEESGRDWSLKWRTAWQEN